MVNYCSVYNCKNSSVKNPKLSFFLIPGDTFRQMIWLPKMGRQEWILKRPELLHKKRICNLFKEGIGEKGVNVNASTSASTSSMDIENNETVDECREISINPNIYTTPEKKPEETQTSPSLSSATPRKRKLQSVVKNLKRKLVATPEKKSVDISDEDFIRFCRKNFNSTLADFMISQLKLRKRKPHGYRYSVAFKQFALTIYFLGPKVYQFLQKTFFLPHKATLCRITTNWDFSVGLNEHIFQAISLKTRNMDDAAKDCIVCVDEMSIKTHLFYNISLDQIIGFHQSL
ncbi:uncharacterized protein LOC123321626 isoform X2 [Coccinella septempunctata]|uniref:uncharacterized protein LOC123314393 isoform X2 n=1 Tax=Coccinella septempunctata TaxID=41139 RepID=UPI001D065399|nr:uncharacterized protein LOC123314393 isoform X2 [Coccinella septempunctata]XP_044762280.1 uncharacterized protein LOC123319408 isoform X2 [Coccinella septempunctata]XP_044765270.1 uncharacterized protein LOC123321626 isoform X2 [Coccinella septempunctata]